MPTVYEVAKIICGLLGENQSIIRSFVYTNIMPLFDRQVAALLLA